MIRAAALLCALLAAAAATVAAQDPSAVHHEIEATVEPGARTLRVRDRVRLPERLRDREGRGVHLLLRSGLEPRVETEGATLRRAEGAGAAESFGPGVGAEALPEAAGLDHLIVDLPPGADGFTLTYGGVVHDPLSAEQDYARGFRQTSGLVSEEGTFLSGATLWYPWLGDDPLSFSLEVVLPAGWDAVSQGRRTRHERGEAGTRARWESHEPQDEIYLIAGPFTEYRRPAAPAEVQVFLRQPDPALAGRYLEAGAQYLDMYSRLLGAYPYPKFALVENFWDTGWGMPSFTLLGSRIIRFPFILHSSYPHEILHNWWGNGVYVDYASGNWCEGLTAYLADHLIQEGRGAGAEYRQATLQKYADYVSRGLDFPLAEFRSRHSSATEAVGYGKSLMLYHMLRRDLGDRLFVDGLRRFYADRKFRTASFADLRNSLEAASGKDLGATFDQWVERAGAPALRLQGAAAEREGDGWAVRLRLAQVQPGPPYTLRVPAAVTVEGRAAAVVEVLEFADREQEFHFPVPGRPLRVDVDPEFDLFRRLDPAEIPPALSGGFGAERVLAVLPADAAADLRSAYRELAESWARSQPGQWEVVEDSAVEGLPADRAVWLFGWDNRLLPALDRQLAPYGARAAPGGASWPDAEAEASRHSVVLVGRHPDRADLTVSWVATANAAALPGLGRKLPHYHKYSALSFEGDEPANVAKTRWPVVGSPLTAQLGDGPPVDRAALPPREPLAKLPPAFSAERMRETVRFLSAPEREGRGFGSGGLEQAAEFIAAAFREAGLAPGGEEGGYFRSWRAEGGDPPAERVQRNVVGRIPGSRPEWDGQSVVVAAHYDHLGTGWPSARAEERGRLHPGADDNASGVAVLLELARVLGRDFRPERTVIFAAFAGEEAGRLGSRKYVEGETSHPAGQVIGMVNLDTVGRLGAGKLLVLGADTAREWVHIFNGASYVTGVPVEVVARDPGGSDQVSFHEAGVPAVQLFTGPHLDYHRSGDVPEKVDAEGLVKVAAVAKEVVEYLSARAEPLTRPEGESPANRDPGHRQVRLGTAPDSSFPGPGVRLSGVVPGSPAEESGLREGDVIVELGGEAVGALADLSRALKALEPGREVTVRFLRDGQERTASARVVTR